MSKAPFEQHLVSMVSSLIHLRSIGDELRKKPFVIPRMQSSMAGSARAFGALTESFEQTAAALQTDAHPYLAQWLSSLGLQIGSEIRFEGSGAHRSARVRGGLAEVRLHPRLIEAKRCVVLVLEGPSFAVDGGAYLPFEAFTAEELSLVLTPRRCARVPVTDAAGTERHVVTVSVPIRREDLDAMARSCFDIHLV